MKGDARHQLCVLLRFLSKRAVRVRCVLDGCGWQRVYFQSERGTGIRRANRPVPLFRAAISGAIGHLWGRHGDRMPGLDSFNLRRNSRNFIAVEAKSENII